jgi:hypothetical protein
VSVWIDVDVPIYQPHAGRRCDSVFIGRDVPMAASPQRAASHAQFGGPVKNARPHPPFSSALILSQRSGTVSIVEIHTTGGLFQLSTVTVEDMEWQTSRIVFPFALNFARPPLERSEPRVVGSIGFRQASPETLVGHVASKGHVAPKFYGFVNARVKRYHWIPSEHQSGNTAVMKSRVKSRCDVGTDDRKGTTNRRLDAPDAPCLESPAAFDATPLNVIAVTASLGAVSGVEEQPDVDGHSSDSS